MQTLNIALLQLKPAKDLDESLKKGLAACREAKSRGADLALFPEMWNTGYRIPQELSALRALALDSESPYLSAFSALAKELTLAIGVTFLEAHAPLPRNSLALFDSLGERVFTYSKVHTCDFGEERLLSPGDDFAVGTLRTARGALSVGAMICYDREFPESARILMLKGAELILVPNACPIELNRLAQLRGRAYENMLAIATVNYPTGVPDCNGHSSLFDGVAYAPDGSGARDTCVLEAGEDEGIFIAELPLALLRVYRQSEVHGNAYRRPRKYALLLDETVRPPFVRADRRNR